MGHYYAKDGTPEHFRGPNGSATTLREARKLGLLPSVTTVLDLIAKPGLEKWKRDQVALAALTLPRLEGEASSDLLRRIDADASRQAHEAADTGTAIHAAIEAALRSEPFPSAYSKHVGAVRQVIHDNWPNVTDWKSEHRFAHPSGFGGCVDLVSASAGVILDFKGTAIAPDEDKQLAYDQFHQLGGYAVGLNMPAAIGANLFISRTHPGHVRLHFWTPEKMRTGQIVFTDTLRLWKSLKSYDGGW